MNNTPLQKTLGRPVDLSLQETHKQKLLSAAAKLLQTKSYKSITIRQLAAEAGTQSAMISYYFGNKQGLFQALIDSVLQNPAKALAKISSAANPIYVFIEFMLDLASQKQGLIRFIHDEVLAQQSPLSEQFLQGFPKKLSVFVTQLIQTEINQGHYRSDLHPKHAAFSLMSLIMTPFVNTTISQQVWQIDSELLATKAWAKHIYQLFNLGCQALPQIVKTAEKPIR